MTPEEYIAKQRAKWAKIAAGDPLEIAVFETARMQANRIFNDGKDSLNTKIGNYNTSKPIYVNPKNSPKKFPTKGKLGNTKKKNGEPYKTSYFTSYKQFRSAIGRATDKVNLQLFGQLQNDFVTGIKKISNSEYVQTLKQQINFSKARGQEKHFGKPIFSLTKSEIEYFKKVVNEETIKILNA